MKLPHSLLHDYDPTNPLLSRAKVMAFEELGSTSAQIHHMAREPSFTKNQKPLWISAHRQNAGYGRRKRPWVQFPGDFAASFYFPTTKRATELNGLPLLVGLAVLQALQELISISALTQRPTLTLKWPNDILMYSNKLCGTLIELIPDPSPQANNSTSTKIAGVCIGIGINILSTQRDVDYETSALGDINLLPECAALLHIIDHYLHSWLCHWQTAGFSNLMRQSWLEHAAGIGEPIIVRRADSEISGIFEDVNENGQLILRAEQELQYIDSGDIIMPITTKHNNKT